MEQTDMFSCNYSAEDNQQVDAIRRKYLPHQESPVDTLRAMDARVRKPANLFAWLYGAVSAIIMGAGMSLVMTEVGAFLGIGDSMVPGLVIGVVGLGMALLTYPVYKRILQARKRKFAPQILQLSAQILGE